MSITKGASLTMSGNACALPVGRDQRRRSRAGFLLFHFPEHAAEHASGLRDGASALAAIAGADADRVRLVFSSRRVRARGFRPEDAIEFWDMTNKQDWHVCELSQQGIASRAYRAGALFAAGEHSRGVGPGDTCVTCGNLGAMPPPLTYASYLDLEKLLSLQKPRSSPPEHDETLFIIIHQTYELWFKQLLHEFEKIKRDFSAGDLFGAIHTFKRVRTIMKVLVAQVDILETMTPSSFSSFRDRLETASGFQSVQFREMEFALGYKRASTVGYLKPDFPGYDRLQKLLHERSVIDHFYDFLAVRGAQIPAELENRNVTQPNGPDERVQKEILRLYKDSPECSILFELMTDFDEGLQEWRYRHIKLVERTIGAKKGTGGSPGVPFLKESLFKPVFPDLWAIRHEL